MNTSSQRWGQILQSIEPDYYKILEEMSYGPDIKPVLTISKGKKIMLTMQEIWPNSNIQTSSGCLDERINWTENELMKWKNVKRMSWDSWQFDCKRSAEKFITLYYIQWVK